MFNELTNKLVAILRYIASPVVGIEVVLITFRKPALLREAANLFWPWCTPPSLWVIAVFFVAAGLAVYFMQRTCVHWFIVKGFHWCLRRRGLKVPKRSDLDFARWERRGAKKYECNKSAQLVLDEGNAAGDFLYSSAWCSILFMFIVWFDFPICCWPTWSSLIACIVVVAVLFSAALLCDWRTTSWDVEAFNRYCGDRSQQPASVNPSKEALASE
jgi:hypothetical protein